MSSDWLSTASIVSAAAWLILATFHSVLGEKLVLKPLFGESGWKLPRMPRARAEILLRFAWHITSVTWLALAGIAVGLPITWCLMAVALVGGFGLFWSLRGHLAWPVFLLAGLASAWTEGLLEGLARPVALATSACFFGLGLLHVYWAVAGDRGRSSAIPSTSDGEPVINPGRLKTLAVAASLFVFAVVLVSNVLDPGPISRGLVAFGILVLGARAIGDGRYVGFSKRIRGTSFALLDDRFYTPLVVFLAFGSGGALLA